MVFSLTAVKRGIWGVFLAEEKVRRAPDKNVELRSSLAP